MTPPLITLPLSAYSLLSSSLFLSLKIALLATVLCAMVAIPLAFVLAKRSFPLKSVLEAFITLPLVLPPTVVGYLLLVLFGRNGAVGRWLYDAFGYSIIFRVEGAVLACALVSLPLLYLPAKAAFASIDREMEDTARLMGATPLQVFRLVAVPMAHRGILSGLLLGFARALGEFGATVMVLGSSPRGMTLSMVVYFEHVAGTPENAIPAVIALVAVSLGLILLYNRSGSRD